ncbi:MAG: DUF4179 domain-containing protein [Ginsengibacter sp.]
MTPLSDKLNNYSVPPPADVWDGIARKLDDGQLNKSPGYRKKRYYMIAAAAGIVILVGCFVLFTVFSNHTNEQIASSVDHVTGQKKDTAGQNEIAQKINDNQMRVPDIDDNKVPKAKESGHPMRNTSQVKIPAEKKDTKTKNEKNSSLTEEKQKSSYITIAGPEGQPVKISAKAAALIESSDEKSPPHTVWNKKINKWRDIMKANTLAPTPGNFLDIVELNNALTDKN